MNSKWERWGCSVCMEPDRYDRGSHVHVCVCVRVCVCVLLRHKACLKERYGGTSQDEIGLEDEEARVRPEGQKIEEKQGHKTGYSAV